MANSDARYRVVYLSEVLRSRIKTHREANGLTNQQVISSAVSTNLPWIVQGLKDIGFGLDEGRARPSRLPFDDAVGTLADLSDASESLGGVPASTLLRLCLHAETMPPPTKRRRRQARRKAQQKKAGESRSHN